MVKRAVFLCVIAIALPSAAGEPLAMRVSPRVALEPALLTVRTTVEANPDNRALEIVAQSERLLSQQLHSARRRERAPPERLRIQESPERNLRRDERARRIAWPAGHRVAAIRGRTGARIPALTSVTSVISRRNVVMTSV